MASERQSRDPIHAAYLLYVDYSYPQYTCVYEYYDIDRPIEDAEAEPLIKDIAREAHKRTGKYRKFCYEFKDLVINRVSYYAWAVVNCPNLDESNPLLFTGPGDDGKHTFSDPRYTFIEVDRTKVQIAYYKNDLQKHGDNRRLDRGECEQYGVMPNLVGNRGRPEQAFLVRRRDDPGGTNMGGSVPPPPGRSHHARGPEHHDREETAPA